MNDHTIGSGGIVRDTGSGPTLTWPVECRYRGSPYRPANTEALYLGTWCCAMWTNRSTTMASRH